MFATPARALVLAALAAVPALAQLPATATRQFQTGPYYAGPRVWLGNLNGAVAIGGQVERGFTQAGAYGPGIIAGGVGIDYYSWDQRFPGGRYSYSVVPFQLFGNYHFVVEGNRKLDPYLGLALVYSHVNASWSGAGAGGSTGAGSGVDIAGQGGVRYFVTDRAAVQAQVGFGYGTLGLGGAWRF